ncbi:TIGR00645 family protein [Legionella jordanis]|uniref:UPF0114 protein Ljor_2728 n=1 Tax=Legionella jordanis TaxID=456 RepID=A0A0W0VF41_9GAMM|nr:TIGR00645 family protein [Legionella jordanis]KTD18422.1 transmembrane protein [Legionella jordanis]RMX05328.1 TIGR00645 family protein [Legionella jordanis]RMX20821.1 TIGR00645 family protein [Legionella jordanis]VEH13229.1 transmembrane protein [Legionella jordanis]HAT8713583.1 TIGR00645 family protein [Legionella jordanis]
MNQNNEQKSQSKGQQFAYLLSQIIFMGRWIQAPLYLGLLLILMAYAYRFIAELFHLMGHIHSADNTEIMLGVLDLIDVVMIANLLIMVIMGGYETFVSKLNLSNHPDQPEWLDHIDAGAMKIKLALALIGISSIHLLRTFIDPATQSTMSVMWQVIIHLTLLLSALAIAYTNKLLAQT